jgi:hypothetical protein
VVVSTYMSRLQPPPKSFLALITLNAVLKYEIETVFVNIIRINVNSLKYRGYYI